MAAGPYHSPWDLVARILCDDAQLYLPNLTSHHLTDSFPLCHRLLRCRRLKAGVTLSENRSRSNDYGAACRASAISTAAGIDVLALLLLPIYAANGGFGRAMAIGLGENALQDL